MAEVKWQARRVSDGVLVDVTGDTAGTPAVSPTENALEGTTLSATVTLTDAQIKALPTTAIDVVPAQGANTVIAPVLVTVITNLVTAYTNRANSLLIVSYQKPSGTPISFAETLSTSIPLVAATGLGFITPASFGTSQRTDIDNRALQIRADNLGAGDFTGGNASNAMKVTVLYTVVTT